jgi:hypothetical protein
LQSTPLVHVDHGPNYRQGATAQHYVVLVSLDGFRWDYAKARQRHASAGLGKQGVWAPEGMLPSYPSLTFPNHFTIVTGLYPEHHGLVANSFLDPAARPATACPIPGCHRRLLVQRHAFVEPRREPGNAHRMPLLARLRSRDRRLSAHLVRALRQPTTEATPAVSRRGFDDAVALLKLPPADRPHFITIYYSEPDHEGHEFGPDAPETAPPCKDGWLVGKLKGRARRHRPPIDLVVVSDHGMATSEGPWITLDQFADLTGFDTVGSLLYGKTEEDRVRVYNQLKKVSSQFVVYRAEERAGRPQLQPEPPRRRSGGHRHRDPTPFAPTSPPGRQTGPAALMPGMHGFDPRKVPEMKASFFAAGPDIVKGKTVAPV